MADVEFTLKSNKDLLKDQTEDAIITALQACGVQAQAHATAEITAQGAVDTGRLRASITYAVSGDPARQHSYSDDQGNGYTQTIEGAGESTDHTLYLGTNVVYASFVENGTQKMPARPFIRPAIENFLSEYQQIFTQVLSQIGK
jgi:HK97 gp10 family phage protein